MLPISILILNLKHWQEGSTKTELMEKNGHLSQNSKLYLSLVVEDHIQPAEPVSLLLHPRGPVRCLCEAVSGRVVTSSQDWPNTENISVKIETTEWKILGFWEMLEYQIPNIFGFWKWTNTECYFSNSTFRSPPFKSLNSLNNLWQHCIRPPRTSLVTQTQWPSMTGLTRSGFTGDI